MMATGLVLGIIASVWCAYLAGTRRIGHAILGGALPLVAVLLTCSARQASSSHVTGMVIALVVCTISALWCGLIAQRKHLNPAGYALLGFLLPVIGFVVVGVEPPKAGTQTAA